MLKELDLISKRNISEIVQLLSVENSSPEFDELMARAKEITISHLGRRGLLWCAIGLDYIPCPMSCKYCAFSEKWNIIKESYELKPEEAVDWAKYFIAEGADRIILRTGEAYPVERLAELGRTIKEIMPEKLKLVANTRELTVKQAGMLRSAGFDGIYTTIRLREGIDTDFNIEKRRRAINDAKKAGLEVYSLVEPIGPEHTYEEIAERIIELRDSIKPVLIGAMARVPVEGTPLFHFGKISQEELAKITAVTVLSILPFSDHVELVCSHPASAILAKAGANAFVIEVGAIPRDKYFSSNEWQRFTVNDAKKFLTDEGYVI